MNKYIIYIFAVVAGVVLIAGGYIAYMSAQKTKTAAFNNTYVSTYGTYTSGDYGATIDATKTLALQAPNNDSAALARSLQATALFDRNQGDDRQQAAQLLKSIVADPGVSNALKASAVSRMARWYTYINSATMQSLVFSTPPYSDYLKQANGDVLAATIALYQKSIDLAPSTFAYYNMASLSARVLQNEGIDLQNKAQVASATKVRQEVAAGDALLSNVDFSLYGPLYTAHLYLVKALGLGTAARYFSDMSTTTVDAAYEQAIASADLITPVDRYDSSVARFAYAAMLQARGGSVADAKLTTLLDWISKYHDPNFDIWVQRFVGNPADYRDRLLPAFAKQSPAFAAYVKSLGWKQ